MCGIQHWWVWWGFFVIIREDCLVLDGGNALRQCFRSGLFVFKFTLAECISQEPSHLVAASAGYWDMPGLWPARGKVCVPLLPCLQEFFHADSLSKSKESSQDPPHLAPLPQEESWHSGNNNDMPMLQLGLCEMDVCRWALFQQSRMLTPRSSAWSSRGCIFPLAPLVPSSEPLRAGSVWLLCLHQLSLNVLLNMQTWEVLFWVRNHTFCPLQAALSFHPSPTLLQESEVKCKGFKFSILRWQNLIWALWGTHREMCQLPVLTHVGSCRWGFFCPTYKNLHETTWV